MNKSKGKNDHNEHPVYYKSFLFVPIGKKPASSQQDSVYCLWDVKMKLLDNSNHII